MIAIRGVTKSFGPTKVLRGVDLTVARGEFLALMGESGSGKSTLLNLVSGIDTPDAGSVSIDGTEITLLDDDGVTRFRRERIGFVFQFFNLLEHLTAAGNVEVPILLNRGIPDGEARSRARAILAEVGLGDTPDQRVHRFSGGERQRVAIARALVHGPDVVIADEPTGSLDSTNGERALALIKGLCRDAGVTVLMATHSAQVAAFADRVVRMVDGRVADDPPGPTERA